MKKMKSEFLLLKKESAHLHMNQKQVQEMQKKIALAKQKKHQQHTLRICCRLLLTAAVFFLSFMIVPNLSQTAAYTMSRIPLLGKLIEVVVIREYQYEDSNHKAQIQIPALVLSETASYITQTDSTLEQTAQTINQKIQTISDALIQELTESMEQQGHKSISIQPHIINTNSNLFTLRLTCTETSGSSTEWDYFFTIDLQTGNQLFLKDLFLEEADYKSVLTKNIHQQMEEQMHSDSSKTFWINENTPPDYNFELINDQTEFYLNEQNQLVIVFNEGDVAPMYMGCVEFVIPDEILQGIKKPL